MTIPVLFVGGSGNGVVVDFPDFTLLPDFYPLPTADGRTMEVYVLDFDSERTPQCIYRHRGES